MKKKILMSVVCVCASIIPALLAQSGGTHRTGTFPMFAGAHGSYLGIGVADVDAERARALNLKEERGVEIKNVVEGSPAAKAGLKVGDVVLEYNGEKVEGMEQFMRMVRETPPGRHCTLVVWRNGATQKVDAVIGTRSRTMVIRPGGDEFSFEIPPIPSMPQLPDLPGMMSYRNASLGVDCESLTSQLAEYFGVKDGGVLVRSVMKDSAAEKAGIKAGDVIVKVGDTKVSSPRQITGVLRGLQLPKTLPVVVVRRQQEMTLNVTLEKTRSRHVVTPDRAWIPDDEA
ncbi:MAG: PDZ domain-containing protein [Acidobacteria bacterium]|nr:PDZ domain-containing protein [Acidobacteriota bacterium]